MTAEATDNLTYRPVLRHVAQQWECDHQGHWNVRHYMGWMADALYALAAENGFDQATASNLDLGLAGVHAELDIKREVLAGDVIEVRVAVVDVADKRVTLRHRFVRIGDEALIMTSLLTAVCLDKKARRSAPFPPTVLARLKSLHSGAQIA